MSPDRFEHLLSLVGPFIKKEDTNYRKAIEPAQRLALTLRYLASGDSQQSLTFSFRMSASSVSNIIRETTVVIWEKLAEYVKAPRSAHDWLMIEKEFKNLWNLDHCIGAIDGKHVCMENPPNCGSVCYNYKGFYSIVLLAICDANYNFLLVDVGQYGSNNDSGVLANSEMGERLEEGRLRLPAASKVDGCSYDPLPYYFVGDEAFPLGENLMRPYPGKLPEPERVFNYRLSRARRVIENAFGLLRTRWRIFSRPIKASLQCVEDITFAAIALHNYLRQTDNATYCPYGFIDSQDSSGNLKLGEWRKQSTGEGMLKDLPNVRGSRPSACAKKMRDDIKDYVNSEKGAVEWQLKHVRRT